MWVYSTGQYCKTPIRIFEYQPGRHGNYPQKFLKGFQGYLHTDAYPGYNKVSGITRCFCWTHLRRNFVDSLPSDIQSPESTLPQQGILYINNLFELEKGFEPLSAEERKTQRLKRQLPVLEAFWSWIDSIKDQILPKSKLGSAVNYALNQKEGLMNYLKDGNCCISINANI